MCTKRYNKNGAGAMATVKDEVFIGLLDENFYLVRKELTFGGRRNCSRWMSKLLASGGDYALSPIRKNLADI